MIMFHRTNKFLGQEKKQLRFFKYDYKSERQLLSLEFLNVNGKNMYKGAIKIVSASYCMIVLYNLSEGVTRQFKQFTHLAIWHGQLKEQHWNFVWGYTNRACKASLPRHLTDLYRVGMNWRKTFFLIETNPFWAILVM